MIIEYARAKGLSAVESQVLHENEAMPTMWRELGFEISEDPSARYVFSLRPVE